MNKWEQGVTKPDHESCELIAVLSGYPKQFVLSLAGRAERFPIEEVEIIPELQILLRHYSPDDQRRILPAVGPLLETLLVLREDPDPYDPGPPPTV